MQFLAVVTNLPALADAGVRTLDVVQHAVKGVAGHVQPDQFLLPLEHLPRVSFRNVRQVSQQVIDHIKPHAGCLPEQAQLADIRRPVMLRAVIQHAVKQRQQLGA